MPAETQPASAASRSRDTGSAGPAPQAQAHKSRSRRRRKNRDESEIGVLNLAEQAFHLLRTTPLASLWLYYLGTIPFAVGVFFFWADMSRSSYASQDAALGSLAIAGVWLWMKFWQGRFCRALWQQLQPSGNKVELGSGRQLRYLSAQALVHAFALPLTIFSTVFVGWAVAFFQNATVLAFTQDYGRKPLRFLLRDSGSLARYNWMQNYLVLLVVAALSFFVWMNVLGATVLIPFSLKMFLGIETVFTLNPESSILNTTFLFGTTMLSFLVLDPLLKAIYTLRCFRGLSRTSGADLLSRLDRIESEKAIAPSRSGMGTSAAIALAVALLLLSASTTMAQNDAPSPLPSAEQLERSIQETLQDKAYQWRMPRQDIEESAVDGERGWLAEQMTALANSFERMMKQFGEATERLFRKLFEGRESSRSGPNFDVSGGGAGIGMVAKVLFITLIAALVIWIVVLLVRKAAEEKPEEIDAGDLAGAIDLESDTIVATQLPEDEWMKLAREQIAKGEHRLAVRALFLASLANLGERGLLRVARFKSNRDYTRELRLKARALPDVQTAFQENVGLFERVWYGLHDIGREAVDRFTANYERITVEAPPSATPGPASPPTSA